MATKKIKKINKTILELILEYSYYILVSFILFSILILYFTNEQGVSAEAIFGGTTLDTFIPTFYEWAIQISGGIAIIMIIYAGYLYVTSAGEVEQHKKAKDLIIGTLSGLTFLILAGLIYQTISIPSVSTGASAGSGTGTGTSGSVSNPVAAGAGAINNAAAQVTPTGTTSPTSGQTSGSGVKPTVTPNNVNNAASNVGGQ